VVVGSLFWIEVLCFLGLGAFVIYHGPWNTRGLIGIAMAVVGFGLWMLARVQLGRSFAVRAQANTLVTTCLYSKFRHPIYLFGGIAYLGLFISWGKLIPLLCFLLIYPVQILRARKEQKVLEQAFGEEYRGYKAGTWF
jgi:protein-S-isoprenylcysteine O-methyltransferase Ste14